MTFFFRIRLSLLALIAAVVFGATEKTADAYGLQFVHFPTVAPASGKITIDGDLKDWRSANAFPFSPFGGADNVARSSGDKDLNEILLHPPKVSIKAAYDSDALYLALEWTDKQAGTNQTAAGDAAHWSAGGEGFELHLLTDEAVHIACWPKADGKGLAVMMRLDQDTTWTDASQAITAAGAPGDDKGFVQEIKIPWSAITKAGKLPAAGGFEMAADFSWNSINAATIEAIRKANIASGEPFRGTQFCFLSAQAPALGEASLQRAEAWGNLAVGGAAAGDQAVITPEQSTLAEMPLVTATQPPAMDGTLTGWDPKSFQTAVNLPGFLGDRYKCLLATQSDADNFYVAAHFSALGPFTNVKPEVSQAGFSGGDALQIRLGYNNKFVNLCGWYDTHNSKPALTSDGKEQANPFLLQVGAKEQFKMDADGKGYVQEISVPWSALFSSAPKEGEHVRSTFQAWFSDLTPRFSFFSKIVLGQRGALAVTYKMPQDGQLTLGLYDKDDHLLRWLVQGEFRNAGDVTDYWDGYDQWGKPIEPGDYSLKATYHPPLSLDYQMTVCNPGNPPWPTPDDHGDWLNDEATPQAVVTDGKWVYLASPGNEKGYSLIALDEKRQRQWSLTVGFNPHCVSLSVSGNYLYVLYAGPQVTDTNHRFTDSNLLGVGTLICIDKRTGKPANFTVDNPRLRAVTWPYKDTPVFLWDLRKNQTFSPFNYAGQNRYFCRDVGEADDALSLAVTGGKVYISMASQNKLVVLDAMTAKPAGDDIPVDSPAGLAVLNENTLLAVSGKQVVKVDLGSKSVTPFISSQLVAPDNIAVDKAGTIYVSDWGTSFQVKAFNGNGAFLHAIGKEGGRPWVGKWDKDGMLVPRGICVPDDGKLWVAEDDASPKRTSVWDSQTGAFVRDYIGPTPYGGGTTFWMDPKDPTLVHEEGTTFKVDYATKTYTPLAIDYRQGDQTQCFTPNGHDLDGYQTRVMYHDGKEYLFTKTPRDRLTILQQQGDKFVPVAAFGTIPFDAHRDLTPDSDAIFVPESDAYHVILHYYPPFFAGHMESNYSWTDDNGDGEVQPDEMHWVKTAGNQPYQDGAQALINGYWNLDISSDWSVFFPERFRDKLAIMRLDVKGWTDSGAPIYDMAEAKPFVFFDHDQNINAIHFTNDKKVIVAFDYEGGQKTNRDSIEAFDTTGKMLWGIAMPKRFEGKNVHANCVAYDFDVPGIGDVFCTWLYHGSQKAFFLTSDGSYIGTALDETLLGPTAIWSESARYFYQGPDGTPYIINGANQQSYIFKIKGMAGGRFDGNLSLTSDDMARAVSSHPAPEELAGPKPPLHLKWFDEPPSIDGDVSEWDFAGGASMDGGKGRSAEVALGRDADNLYVAYRVHEPTPPLVNGGDNWRQLFITGDCVDLMLQTDPKADPKRTAAAEGDERLLLSVYQGEPIAILYKPVVSGTTDPVLLGSAKIDQIIRLDSAKVTVGRDTKGQTYVVEASMPLHDLGIDPNQRGAVRGDVGVIFADETGHNRALRLYYNNQDTSMTADLPTESRLQPSQWGELLFPDPKK